ncbi:MAG: hypothetical protein SCK29_06370 [Bacillota bacterium]|nr:hypothetical protein [Bacillota bacterium]
MDILLIIIMLSFQQAVARMLCKDKGRDIVLIDLAASAFGLVVVMLAFFVY